jgi:hypothetical protein
MATSVSNHWCVLNIDCSYNIIARGHFSMYANNHQNWLDNIEVMAEEEVIAEMAEEDGN